MNGLWPSVIVLVATVRALKHHGGVEKAALATENLSALSKGMENLLTHIRNIREIWKLPAVVAVNRFASDTRAEWELLRETLKSEGVEVAPCDGWAEGGKGVMELAEAVCRIADQGAAEPSYTYEDSAALTEKIETIARRVYHAKAVEFSADAKKTLAQLQGEGYGTCPVCIAKTQYSLSDNPKLLGAPEGYTLTIRSARLSAGAGFVVAFAGEIIAMPGLPKAPAALSIDVNEQGEIEGLF